MEVLKLCLSALFSYFYLFAIAKLLGHKQISQLDFFDYITGISIGSIAAELATEIETFWQPCLAMLVYAIAAFLLGVIINKFPRTRKYLNGTPSIIMDDGKLYRENMKKAKLDLSEFLVMCRQQGYFDISTIQTAVFEYSGKLSILPVSARRPATPEDMTLSPKQEYLLAEVIMDGRVLGENLRRMGLDENWLQKQLAAQGYESPQEIFLGLCDREKNLSLYKCL